MDRPPRRRSIVGPAARRGARVKTLAEITRRGGAILGSLGETGEEHRLEIRRYTAVPREARLAASLTEVAF